MDFVYVVTDGAGLTKIGISGNPANRLRNLQTASPARLSMPFQIATPYAFEIEQEAHSILGAYRVSGEWFMVNKEMAVAAIFGAASRLGYSLTEDPPRPLITRGQLWFWFKMAIFAYFMFFMVLGHAAHAGELLFPKSLKPSKVCGPQGTELCTGRELTELRERIKVLWFQSSDNVEYRCALMPSDFSLAKCLLMLNLEEENDAKN